MCRSQIVTLPPLASEIPDSKMFSAKFRAVVDYVSGSFTPVAYGFSAILRSVSTKGASGKKGFGWTDMNVSISSAVLAANVCGGDFPCVVCLFVG